MRTGFYIALCGAFITGAAFAAVSGRMELSISLALGALATLCIVYRTAVLPVKAIRTGMDLLKSQDFASRLRKSATGRPTRSSTYSTALWTPQKKKGCTTANRTNFSPG